MKEHAKLSLPNPHTRGLAEEVHDLLRTVRQSWRIVALAVVVSLTLAVTYLARKKVQYQATSRILVIQQGRTPVSLAQHDTGQFEQRGEDDLATQSMIIRSRLVVGLAVESLGRKDVSVDRAIEGLTVTRPDPAAKILQVSIREGDRDLAMEMVRAVTESYQRFLDDKYQKSNQEDLSLIKKARDELSKELQDLEASFLQLQQENSEALSSDESGRTYLARRLDQWDRAANEAMINAMHLKKQLALGRELAESGVDATTVEQAMDQLGGGIAHRTASQEVTSRDSQRGRLIADLFDVEVQRKAAELFIEQLRSDAGPGRQDNGPQLERKFRADPEAAILYEAMKAAKKGLAESRRLSRSANDPAVVRHKGKLAALEQELKTLWVLRRPAILADMANGGDAEPGSPLREALTNLKALTARETSIHDKLQQLEVEEVGRLEKQAGQLAKRLGDGDPRVKDLHDRIALIRDRGRGSTALREHEGLATLLGTLEKSLKSVEGMREEAKKRFDEDMAATRTVQIKRIAVSNVANKLERQRALFNTVVDQLKQTQLASDFSGVSAQIIDSPTCSPLRPQVVMIVGLALTVGLVLGTGASVLLEQMDQRLRSPNKIREVLGTKALGVIPTLKGNQFTAQGAAALLSHLFPRSPLAEGYRSVRTNIDFLRRRREAQVIVITSPRPGDGKSTASSNLAISIAYAGRRVLLVDADLRKPSLDRLFEVFRDPGLTQVLQGLLPYKEVIQATRVENLDIITAGPDAPNPAELLTSPLLLEMLEAVRRDYDTIIIDSTPILGIADAAITAGQADGIILVVEAGSVRRQDAEQAMDVLRSVGTRVLGTIINKVIFGQEEFGYGYGSGAACTAPAAQVTPSLAPSRKKEIVVAASASLANG